MTVAGENCPWKASLGQSCGWKVTLFWGGWRLFSIRQENPTLCFCCLAQKKIILRQKNCCAEVLELLSYLTDSFWVFWFTNEMWRFHGALTDRKHGKSFRGRVKADRPAHFALLPSLQKLSDGFTVSGQVKGQCCCRAGPCWLHVIVKGQRLSWSRRRRHRHTGLRSWGGHQTFIQSQRARLKRSQDSSHLNLWNSLLRAKFSSDLCQTDFWVKLLVFRVFVCHFKTF